MLRLLPPQFKLYAEIAAVIGFAILVAWFTHKQREVGRQQVQAANAVAEQNAIINKVELEALARMRAGVIVNELQASRVAPAPSDALSVRVCKPGTGLPSNVRTDGGSRGPSDGEAGLSSGVAEGRDIGPETEQILARANAQVKALQDYIRACQEAGACAK